jgi:hypothetical protein
LYVCSISTISSMVAINFSNSLLQVSSFSFFTLAHERGIGLPFAPG